MTTSLSTVLLPNDLQWLDEDAPKVLQQLKTTLDTTPHITAMRVTAGLPISLQSWTDGAFVSRETALQIQALADQPGLVMSLVLRDTAFQVVFRHHEKKAYTFAAVKDIANPEGDDLYRITLNLMTV